MKAIKRLCKFMSEGHTSPPVDMRGNHGKQRSLPGDVIQCIVSHIASFPAQESHYSRRDNHQRKYLSENLNIKRMWYLYLEGHELEQMERNSQKLPFTGTVKESAYRNIFNTCFNLGFGRPQSDTCATCDSFNIKIHATENEEEKEELKNQMEMHQRRAEKGYEELRSDKARAKKSWVANRDEQNQAQEGDGETEQVDMYMFDFEQNLPVPTLTHSDVFYARQLWVYNFGIHDCVSERGLMYVWSELTAKRGLSEVASCLLKCFASLKTGASSLILYSDGCGGQNKNKVIVFSSEFDTAEDLQAH